MEEKKSCDKTQKIQGPEQQQNILSIVISCPEDISSVLEVSTCFLLKYVTITTVTTAIVTNVIHTTVNITIVTFSTNTTVTVTTVTITTVTTVTITTVTSTTATDGLTNN